MILHIETYIKSDDTFRYAGDGNPFSDDDRYNLYVSHKYFIDPRMSDEELSNILLYARSYVGTQNFYFKVDKNDSLLESKIEETLQSFFDHASSVLTLGKPSKPDEFRTIEDVVRNSYTDIYSYAFDSMLPIFVRISFARDASLVDISDVDIVTMTNALYHSVTNVDHMRKYVVQFFTDILASGGHKGVHHIVGNIMERCWE